ncbi:unnamed protein product [Linum tenue]|uniref:Germin-like protein n=1 Tax=Linum tenue TaxID=586396 RepID=A0AAV0JC18_9ROSI|nr:unnamed protein product [Linum tenue]
MAHRVAFLDFVALALCSTLSLTTEPANLQDFCVADGNTNTRMNGFAYKDPAMVQASDFSFSGLHIPGSTANAVGFRVTPVFVTQIPGHNTLGISIGTLEVGFVTSNPENCHITKVLKKGDVFVFPVGLVHYQRNIGYGHVVDIVALSSQNPGVIIVANAVFANLSLLVSGYQGNNLSSQCAIKVDLMKCFDSVNWNYLFMMTGVTGFRMCYLN